MALVGTSSQMLALQRPVSGKHHRTSRTARIVARSSNDQAPRSRPGNAALTLLGGLIASAPAHADELVQQGLKASRVPQWSSVPVPDFQGVPDDFVSFLSTNPIYLLGGVAAIGIPALLAQGLLSGGGGGAKATSAANALEALTEDRSVLLVDIRSQASVKEDGSPALNRIAGKSISLPFTKVAKSGEVEPVEGWAQRLAKAVKEDSVVILLDAEGREASKAGAALAEEAEVETLYYVQGGAQAWKAAELPWKEKGGLGFSLPSVRLPDLSGGLDSLAEDFKAAPTGGKAALAVGAIGAAAFLFAGEVGNILEIVGAVGAVNLVGRNLLFAKDREKTAKGLKSLVNDKIAVGEAGKDFQKLARTVLETPEPAAKKAAAKVKETAEKVTGKAEDVASKVTGKAEEPSSKVSGKAEELSSKASGKADELTSKASGKADELKSKTSGKAEELTSKASGKAEEVTSKASGKAEELTSKASGKAEELTSKASGKAEEVTSKAKGKAEELSSKAEAKTDDAAKKLDSQASNAAKKADNGTGAGPSEAKQWIDNWKSKSKA